MANARTKIVFVLCDMCTLMYEEGGRGGGGTSFSVRNRRLA